MSINMNTDKLKQLKSLVEGLGGFDKVSEWGMGDECQGITFSYDDEDSEEYLEDDYEMLPSVVLDILHDGTVLLNDIPVISEMSPQETIQAIMYIGETEESHLSEYKGKVYSHMVQVSEGFFDNIEPNKPLEFSESFIETDEGEIILVADIGEG